MISKEALVVGALLHGIGQFEFRPSGSARTASGVFLACLNRFRCLKPLLEEVRHDQGSIEPILREADRLAADAPRGDGRPESLRSLVSVLTAVNIGKGSPPSQVHRYIPGPVDFANPFPERRAVPVPGVAGRDRRALLFARLGSAADEPAVQRWRALFDSGPPYRGGKGQEVSHDQHREQGRGCR